jgi:thiamine-phosphate diphosphorylase
MSRSRLPEIIKGLYVITREEPDLQRTHLGICREALLAGARLIQLREKTSSPEVLLQVAREMSLVCRRAGALFIVNDYVELTANCGAGGFHFGYCPERLAEFRRTLGDNAVLGMSVDTLGEALLAQEKGADYVSLGPIFGTQTKTDLPPPCGLEKIVELKSQLRIPLVVIGGITESNIGQVAAAGADAAAVITAVTRAPSVKQAVENLIRNFRDGRNA